MLIKRGFCSSTLDITGFTTLSSPGSIVFFIGTTPITNSININNGLSVPQLQAAIDAQLIGGAIVTVISFGPSGLVVTISKRSPRQILSTGRAVLTISGIVTTFTSAFKCNLIISGGVAGLPSNDLYFPISEFPNGYPDQLPYNNAIYQFVEVENNYLHYVKTDVSPSSQRNAWGLGSGVTRTSGNQSTR